MTSGTAHPQLRVSMISLPVRDTARSIRFYAETLGLEIAVQPDEVTFVRAGDIMLVLNHPAASSTQQPIAGGIEIIFPVGGVAASYDHLKQRGCDFIATPHEITANMWAATLHDPDGHLLTILGPK